MHPPPVITNEWVGEDMRVRVLVGRCVFRYSGICESDAGSRRNAVYVAGREGSRFAVCEFTEVWTCV